MQVSQATPRTSAQISLPDGRHFEAPVGTPLQAYMRAAYPDPNSPIVAALVNGSLEELTFPVEHDSRVIPMDLTTSDGMRVFHRSITLLLVAAMHEVIPEARVLVDYSVTLGGFFCLVEGRDPLTQSELEQVETRMHEIVDADAPITKIRMPVSEACKMFEEQGYASKVQLFRYSAEQKVTVYSLRGVRDYFYGYMMPSTGNMPHFALELVSPGFVLRLPLQRNARQLTAQRDYPQLTRVFREYGRWLGILGIDDIGSLNQACETGNIHKAILVSEALHEKNISDIADAIVRHRERINLVMIAGPSSSGKTTFARRLAVQLMVNGIRPFALGLDDYFVDRDRTPLDETGDLDFEALEAIDLDLLNDQLLALMAGEDVELARYNFQTGKSERGEATALPDDAMIILEGIHGMNPALVERLPSESIYRVYVSALTQLNIDHHNRVPTTDTRLLRRIIRDAQNRGYSAQETIQRWESVRRGEERYIFPYQENADSMFNSALVYELAVLKPFAEPLLLRVPRGTMEYVEARRLLAFLRWVQPCATDYIPSNSILREFIGGSILRDFQF